MFALFASCSTQYSAALRCAAGKITIDPKAHLLVVRAAFLSMLADCFVAVAVAVVLSCWNHHN